MARFSELGRGLVDKARAIKDSRSEPAEPAEPAESVDERAEEPGELVVADRGEVAEEANRLTALLEEYRPAAGPVTAPWAFGFGHILAEHPKVPDKLGGLARKLNRFGGVAFSAETVELDGDEVPWSEVTEIRTRNLVEYLLGDSIQQQVDALPLPPFPGRKRVLSSVSAAVMTVLLATAKESLDKIGMDLRIAAEVEYKSGRRGGTKLIGAGPLASLVLADRSVNSALLATAQARGVQVVEAADQEIDSAAERADVIRAKFAALEAKLGKLS